MASIKTKLCSLGMAAAMLLALAGCNLSTPSSVGSIGRLSDCAVRRIQHGVLAG